MGESIAEATILKWTKNVGDEVKKDETILEISTDKVDSEIPAPASGVLAEILAEPGKVVPVKDIIAYIETEKGAVDSKPAPKKAAEAPKSAPAKSEAPAVSAAPPAPPVSAAPISAPRASAAPTFKSPYADDVTQHGVGVAELRRPVAAQHDDRFYSPLVRNIAAQHGVSAGELSSIPGSGTHGRVTKTDMVSYLDSRGSQAPKGKEQAPVVRPQFDENGLRVEPFDNMRKRIAEHMVRSKATSPHVYTVNEVDLTNVVKWREKVQKSFTDRVGFKLSFTPFFLEAAAKALVQFPGVNASVDGEALVLKRQVNIGCAVALGTSGLIVPVIKNADQLNVVGIATALNDLATRARNKKLMPDDTQGGTFTVTNPGTFGSIIGYPIISQPQLAIMGVGAIKKRPVVVGDMIAIRDIVYLTLSYDHRVIDGSLGGTFLNFIAKYLENWDLDREL